MTKRFEEPGGNRIELHNYKEHRPIVKMPFGNEKAVLLTGHLFIPDFTGTVKELEELLGTDARTVGKNGSTRAITTDNGIMSYPPRKIPNKETVTQAQPIPLIREVTPLEAEPPPPTEVDLLPSLLIRLKDIKNPEEVTHIEQGLLRAMHKFALKYNGTVIGLVSNGRSVISGLETHAKKIELQKAEQKHREYLAVKNKSQSVHVELHHETPPGDDEQRQNAGNPANVEQQL